MENSLQRAQSIENGIEKEISYADISKWFHLAIIVGSLIFTLVCWQLSKQQVAEKVQSEFDREWAVLVQLISDRMQNYEELLWSGVAAIKSHDNEIDRTTWRGYAEELALDTRSPGVLGVGVIYRVEKPELEGFLAGQRAFAPDFRIHPPVDLDTLFPITFIEPEANNIEAIGLDMTHEPNRYSAALAAAKTAKATVTGPIQLVQGERNTPGFLFFAPFYEEGAARQDESSLIGLVYAPLVFKNLILGTLGQDQRRVSFKLSDGGQLLFDETSQAERDGGKARFTEQKTLPMYGRDWHIEIHSTKELEVLLNSNLPSYVLWVGLAFEIFYVTALMLLHKHRNNAVNLAQQVVQEHRIAAKIGLENEQRYNLAIEGSAVGLWDWDLVNDDIFWSDHFLEFLGLLGHDNHISMAFFRDVLHPDDLGKVTAAVDEHLQGNAPFNLEYRLRHANNSYIWVHVAGQALWAADGTPLRMSGSASDITENKLSADKLITLNSELTKFAHLASHDLKTPLRGINNLTHWIEEDCAGKLDEETVSRLQMIRERVQLTQTMLQDILIYSESGVASVQTEWVKPSQMLAEIVEYMQLNAQQEVIFDKDIPEIYTVATQLRQVFSNTISNAFNHHDRERQMVEVVCEVQSDGLKFAFIDDGPGIPPEYHLRVFELFHTLQAKGKGGGSGLGMSIIKRLVESQHGEVHIESTEGTRGTSICFTWPAILRQEAA